MRERKTMKPSGIPGAFEKWEWEEDGETATLVLRALGECDTRRAAVSN